MGRAGREKVRHFVSDAEYARASRILDCRGAVAIVATRAVPILAEVMSIIAGTTTSMRWWQITISCCLSLRRRRPPRHKHHRRDLRVLGAHADVRRNVVVRSERSRCGGGGDGAPITHVKKLTRPRPDLLLL
jgi:hypothetical protein